MLLHRAQQKKNHTLAGFSLTEEILHEASFEFSLEHCKQYLSLHHIAEAENLQIIHPELLLRPPRS